MNTVCYFGFFFDTITTSGIRKADLDWWLMLALMILNSIIGWVCDIGWQQFGASGRPQINWEQNLKPWETGLKFLFNTLLLQYASSRMDSADVMNAGRVIQSIWVQKNTLWNLFGDCFIMPPAKDNVMAHFLAELTIDSPYLQTWVGIDISLWIEVLSCNLVRALFSLLTKISYCRAALHLAREMCGRNLLCYCHIT